MLKQLPYDIFRKDRPGWIPEDVGDDWNQNPYAYQTQEQLMPAGRFHSLYLQTLGETLGPLAERRGLYFLADVFVFYRDWEGRRQRVAPDALIAPVYTQLDDEQAARSYDLEVEPLPLCAIELTSPSSHERDTQDKRFFYAWLHFYEYLLLDIVDDEGRLRHQVELRLWRRENGDSFEVLPDDEGYLTLESLNLRVRAEGRRLVMQDLTTGRFLLTAVEMIVALGQAEHELAAAEQARVAAEQARVAAEQRAQAEAVQRQQAEAEITRLRAELERLKGSA